MAESSNDGPSQVGLFLQKVRIRAGLSQKGVADILGYNTAQVISDWERGVRSPPGVMLKKLVKLYKVSAEEFYEVILEEKKNLLARKLKKTMGIK